MMLRIVPIALALVAAAVARRAWRRVNEDLDRHRGAGARHGTLRRDENGDWRPSR